MKKILALLLALVMVLCLCACGGEAPAPAAPAAAPAQSGTTPAAAPAQSGEEPAAAPDYVGKTLTVALNAEPTMLIPQYGRTSNADAYVAKCLFNNLYELGEDGTLVPSLAENYEWVDDTHIRVFLRQGVKDVNGNEITASDVEYSFKLGTTQGNVQEYAYFDFDNWVNEDDYTFVMALTAPNPDLWSYFAHYPYFIVDQTSFEALGGFENAIINPMCNSGRYNFVEWVPGQYIKVEFNENYWDDTYVPMAQYIQFIFIGDSAARTMAVQSGTADIAVDLSRADIMSVQNDPNVTAHVVPQQSALALYFNCERKPFDDIRVRQAIRMLIDPADVQAIAGGEIVETSISNVRPGYWAEGKNMIDRTRNVEAAKALLAEAGYADGLTFKLLKDPGPVFDITGQLIQSELAEAGINMEIEMVELPEYLGRIPAADYDAVIRAGGSRALTNLELYRFDYRVEPGVSVGATKWECPDIYDDFDTFYYSNDEAARMAAFAEIQKAIIEGVPVVGFTSYEGYCVTAANISNIQPDCMGYPMIQHVKVG